MKTLSRFAFLILAGISAQVSLAEDVKFEQDPSIPMVYLNVAIKGGSAHDPSGQSGVTNFMGQLLLRGTQRLSKPELYQAFDQIGSRLEVETRTEALILRGAVVSQKLPEFLELLSEVIRTPRFSDAEIRHLKSEIVSQILEERGRDQALARKKWESFLFQGHPYGNSVTGKVRDIEKLTRAQIFDQYRRFFQDANLLVIGSGDAEESFIQSWADRVASSLGSNGGKIEKVAEPQFAKKMRVRIIDKPDRTQTQLYVGHEGVRMDDRDFFPLFVGNHTFGGGSFSARLMTEIREKRGWSYSAYSYFRHGLRRRSWQAFTFPATKDTPDAIGVILQMLKDMKEKGVTEAEFDFAQKSLVNSAGFDFNTPRKRVENILLEKTLELPDEFMKSYGPRVAELDRGQVNEAWKKFLQPSEVSILILGTAKELLPKVSKVTGIPEKEIEVESYSKE